MVVGIVSRSFLPFLYLPVAQNNFIKSGLRLCEGTTKEERLPYETSVYVPPSPSLRPSSRSHPIRTPSRSLAAVPEAGGARARPRYPFLSLSPTRIARGRIGNEASFHHRSIPLWQPLLVRRSGHIDASGHGGTSVSRLHCSSTRPSSSACEDVCALYRARTRRGWKPPSGSGAPVCPLPATYSRFFYYPSLIRIC